MSALYTLRDCEEQLKLSRASIARLVATQKLKSIVINSRSRRVTAEALTAFIREREDEADAARA